MYKYEILALEDYIKLRNNGNYEYDKSDFEDSICNLCENIGIAYVFYGKEYGTGYYCENCLNKIKDFMITNDSIKNKSAIIESIMQKYKDMYKKFQKYELSLSEEDYFFTIQLFLNDIGLNTKELEQDVENNIYQGKR